SPFDAVCQFVDVQHGGRGLAEDAGGVTGGAVDRLMTGVWRNAQAKVDVEQLVERTARRIASVGGFEVEKSKSWCFCP
ncbi:MAG: hypothetical protein ABL898_03470, partial [Hyphomicrobiaceae bacterium]